MTSESVILLRRAEQAVSKLVNELSPRHILVVGSVARGIADERSDIDLLIIDAKNGESEGAVYPLDQDSRIRLEYMSTHGLSLLREQNSPNIARTLHRIRDGIILYSADDAPLERPTMADIRRVFGSSETIFASAVTLLTEGYALYSANDFSGSLLRSRLSTEALAVLLLSIGSVPHSFSKPKYIGTGVQAYSGYAAKVYRTGTSADYLDSPYPRINDLMMLANTLVVRRESRNIRRLLWFANQQHHDLHGNGLDCWMRHAPALVATSFSLAALSSQFDVQYEDIRDVDKVINAHSSISRELIWPLLVPDLGSMHAQLAHNAAIEFLGIVESAIHV